MSTLYHYTCAHALEKIKEMGTLLGSVHPILRFHGRIVWLTDLDVPVVRAIGMPKPTRDCDRLQYRISVSGEWDTVAWWPVWSQRNVALPLRQALEVNEQGALFAHWWLAFGDIPITEIHDIRRPAGSPPVWPVPKPPRRPRTHKVTPPRVQ